MSFFGGGKSSDQIGSVETLGFFNIYALIFIAAFALIWPLQQISMAFIFEPIMMAIKLKMKFDPPMSETKKDKDGRP